MKYEDTKMKTMTCKQLGGACDMEFHAETFDEMAELSRNHGTEMMKKSNAAHMDAMNSMMELMKDPKAVEEWFEQKKKEFDNLSSD